MMVVFLLSGQPETQLCRYFICYLWICYLGALMWCELNHWLLSHWCILRRDLWFLEVVGPRTCRWCHKAENTSLQSSHSASATGLCPCAAQTHIYKKKWEYTVILLPTYENFDMLRDVDKNTVLNIPLFETDQLKLSLLGICWWEFDTHPLIHLETLKPLLQFHTFF